MRQKLWIQLQVITIWCLSYQGNEAKPCGSCWAHIWLLFSSLTIQVLLSNFLIFQWDASNLLALEYKKFYFDFSSEMASACCSSVYVWAWKSTAATSSPHLSLPKYPGRGMGRIKLCLGCSSPGLVCKGMMWHTAHDLTLGAGAELNELSCSPCCFIKDRICFLSWENGRTACSALFFSSLPSRAQWVLRQTCMQCSVLSISLKKQWCQPLFKFLPSELFHRFTAKYRW